jgi:cytochrome P450
MSAEIDAVTARWADGAVINVLAEMLQITTRTFLTVMFSQGLTSDVLSRALVDVTTIVRGLYRQMLTPAAFARLPTLRATRYSRARARLRRLVNDIVVQHRNGSAVTGDLLSTLVAAYDAEASEDNRSLTDAEIFDQLTTFFITGSETTASALSCSLYLLSRHPDVLARLQAEVDQVLTDGPARYEQLSELPMAERILTEALRLYPPGWLFTRTVTTDTQLCGYRLQRGTDILYSPYLLHRLDRASARSAFPRSGAVRSRSLAYQDTARPARLVCSFWCGCPPGAQTSTSRALKPCWRWRPLRVDGSFIPLTIGWFGRFSERDCGHGNFACA